MQDRLNRMRDLRRQALSAFTQINAQMDVLKDVVGAWGNELSGLEGKVSSRAQGRRPNRPPGKYVRLALQLAAKTEDGLIDAQAVVDVAQAWKSGKKPARHNVIRALVEGERLGHLSSVSGRYGPSD